MSASPTDLRAAHSDAEPFGQAGVRQHLGIVVNAIAITGCVIACVMWYRSHAYYDRLEWRGGAEEVRITSVLGRIKIDGSAYEQNINNNAGWSFRTGLTRRPRDGWDPSVWKLIGLEISLSPEGRAASGFWIRIKWYFIAFVCSIIPAISLVLQWRRNREEAE